MFLYKSKSGRQNWLTWGGPPVFTWGHAVGILCGRYWPIPVDASSQGNHWRYNAGTFLGVLAEAVANKHGWAVLTDVNGQYDLIVPVSTRVEPLVDSIRRAAIVNGCRYHYQRVAEELAAIGHAATCTIDNNGIVVFGIAEPEYISSPGGLGECFPILYPERDEDIELPPREGQTEPRLRTRHCLGYDRDGRSITAVTPRDAEWMGERWNGLLTRSNPVP